MPTPLACVGGDSSNRSFHVGKADMKTSTSLRHCVYNAFSMAQASNKRNPTHKRWVSSSLSLTYIGSPPTIPANSVGRYGWRLFSIKENVTAKLSHFLPLTSIKKIQRHQTLDFILFQSKKTAIAVFFLSPIKKSGSLRFRSFISVHAARRKHHLLKIIVERH